MNESPSQPHHREDLVILIPVYNDWAAIEMLLPALDRTAADLDRPARLVLIDDGSTQPIPPSLQRFAPGNLGRIDVLRLRRNLGHQRALAVGMTYIHEHIPCTALLIMDGDGEDSPNDIPRLLEKARRRTTPAVVFAERRLRSENLVFRLFYHLYRGFHRILTGRSVRVGNFSLLPASILSQLVLYPDMWNHYAATVLKHRLPTDTIRTRRAPRLTGKSSMNFVDLVTHGLSAISVYSELVGVRLLIFFGTLSLVTLAGFVAFLLHRLLTGSPASGWTLLAGAFLLLMVFQMGLYALLASFITLGSRSRMVFLPQRDYAFFVDNLQPLQPDTTSDSARPS